MRDGCPPRGPKKGYLKALQKKIGKSRQKPPHLLSLPDLGLTRCFAATEDLQARLENQQDAAAGEMRAFTPPQDASATDALVLPTSRERTNSHSGAGSSVDNNEPHNTAATTPITTGRMQPWPGAPLGLASPMIHLEPWECMDTSNPYSCPTLPALESYQEPSLVTIGPELHITPMMHNDL